MGKRNGSNGTWPKARRARAGFSMIDVAVAIVILVFAVGSLSNAVVTSHGLARSNEETAVANAASRRMAEALRRVTFRDLYRLYNADPQDDPDGPFTGAGPDFDVPGLTPVAGDPDGRVGQISFPTLPDGSGVEVLREDVEDADLGMPRDLNLDGETDDQDRGDDYRLLPVEIRLEWTGVAGPRFVEYHLLLTD